MSQRFRQLETATVGHTGAIWEPPAGSEAAVVSSAFLHVPRVAELPADVERAVIATIARPLGAHETHHEGHASREAEVRQLLVAITPAQACELGKRIDGDRPDDRLMAAIRRWSPDRRQRLRAFVQDLRRRAALRAVR